MRCEIKNGLRQNSPVSNDDDDVRLPLAQACQKLRGANFLRGDDWYLVDCGKLTHRRWGGLLPPASRSVWLGDDADDGVRSLKEKLQCGGRDLRRAHENNSPRRCHWV